MADARQGRGPAPGRVSLVGAGPGDPDLLTLRAVRRLSEADLILYDALSSPEARELAPEARWFYVGKRAGRTSMNQETINQLMIREARRGRDVVRLKSGDPFVLGRGGEEALALAEAGIPFEVVPGVTSAVAAPALAGIPVTHRGLSAGFLVVSGHAPSAYEPALRGLAPDSATVVVLMGLASRAALVQVLLDAGWLGSTPAAIVMGAATPHAWRWIGTLDALANAPLPQQSAINPSYGTMPDAPGLLVIGQVVQLERSIGPNIAAPRAGPEPI